MSKASDRSRRMKAMFSEMPSETSELPQTAIRNASTGAVRSLDSSLSRIEQENETLRRRIAEDQHVVELDPAIIGASFVQDRLLPVESDHGFDELIESIRDNGQQIPILVREHPEKSHSYQIAYGHRRWKACNELGRSVRAIIASLTDEQMVIALGKENTERKDLTFIEQALFAQSLKVRNYKRETIAAALSVPPTNVSKLTTLAQAIPREIINAVGPAPKIGRPRWEALAKLVEAGGAKSALRILDSLLQSSDWTSLTSDARFSLFTRNFKGVTEKREAALYSGNGIVVSQSGQGGSVVFRVIDRDGAGFASHLREELPGLIERFLQQGIGGQRD